ncbi:MAG: invasion associated locus B family protein [Alphaproteobacteria bacterium]
MRIMKKAIYTVASVFLLVSLQSFAEGEQAAAPAAAESGQAAAPSVVQPKANDTQNNAISSETYNFGDWEVRCVLQKMRDQNNNDTGQTRLNSCASRQSFQPKDSKQVILVMGLSYGKPDGKTVDAYPTIFFEAPLGIFLEPIYMRVDKNDPAMAPYRVCTPRSCSAGLAFNEAFYTQFKNGGSLEIAFFVDPTNEPERYQVSLKGFTAASEFMKAAMDKAGQAVTKADLDALAK